MLGTIQQASFAGLLAEEALSHGVVPRSVSYPATYAIFSEGDPGDALYVVDEGIVEITTAMPDHSSRILTTLAAGEFFGEMAVLDDQPRSASARAQTSVRARLFFRDDVLRLMAQSPRLLAALLREVIVRMRRSERRCVEDILQAERLVSVGRFAQSIVHDLKNPLNTIGIGADLASSDDASPEVRKEAGVLVRKQVDKLALMIHEVLEFTRGTARELELFPVNFTEFITAAVAEIRPGAETRGVAVELASEAPAVAVMADRVRLMHVFSNLANNAVDAMKTGGKIFLRFRTEGRHVAVEMEDTGPGIPPEIANRLFAPFFTHGKAHGTGLGLSICKRIIEDHGGAISAASPPGRGAVFCFTLRLQD